jgi:hypothetical protein
MAEIYTAKEYRYIEERLGGKLCRLFGKLNAFLAGGAITSIFANQPIHDFDIFFRDKDSFDKAKRYFDILVKYDDAGTKEVCNTERAVTYTRSTQRGTIAKMKQEKYGPSYDVAWIDEKTTVQLVDPAFLCGSPEEIFMSFDFTICKGAYIFKVGEFLFDKAFLKDISRRELVFNKEGHNVVSSFFRAHKYKTRGFTMTMAEEMKMAMVLGSKKFKTFGDFVRAAGSGMTEEVVQHLYNHIRHPEEKIKGEEDSLMVQPYNADTIIDWLDELVHDTLYVPAAALEQVPTKVGPYYNYEVMKKALDSDLSEESIKDIVDKGTKPGDDLSVDLFDDLIPAAVTVKKIK